jgi:hypothetical protein
MLPRNSIMHQTSHTSPEDSLNIDLEFDNGNAFPNLEFERKDSAKKIQGIPGLLGGIGGALSAASADDTVYGETLGKGIEPKRSGGH